MKSSELEQVELSQKEFPLTWEVILSGLTEEVAPGFVVGLWQKKSPLQIQVAAMGHRRLIPAPLPLFVDTVFDLASLTKILGTATLTGVLVDRGWLSWDAAVVSFFPEYPYRDIRLKHLLSHTAGFVAWEPLWERLRDRFEPNPIYEVPIAERQKQMREIILSMPPLCPIETKALYSDISFLLLGFVLEELTGLPLDQAIYKWVWKPLGLEHTYFQRVTCSVTAFAESLQDDPAAPGVAAPGVAATEDCPWRGAILEGQVHDDNCWAMGGYGGHAGAFGPIRDVLHFARGLMTGFISPKTLHEMWTRVSLPPGCERTLGWDTPSGGKGSSVGRFFSPHSVGHLGFTGTSLWIDPEAELAVALLSNRVHPSRENMKIRAFRTQFHEALRLDLSSRE